MGFFRNGRFGATLLVCPAIALLVFLCSIGCRADDPSGRSPKPAATAAQPEHFFAKLFGGMGNG